jgi:hypothetical protein
MAAEKSRISAKEKFGLFYDWRFFRFIDQKMKVLFEVEQVFAGQAVPFSGLKQPQILDAMLGRDVLHRDIAARLFANLVSPHITGNIHELLVRHFQSIGQFSDRRGLWNAAVAVFDSGNGSGARTGIHSKLINRQASLFPQLFESFAEHCHRHLPRKFMI